ncbi:MAG: type II toxin-antitoxin system RelB/DinJ family antitoxin [Oscillospiraceae bacterium]|nr:type II toxin-antitoxin system RelB/DinJ family antitoxin [Oscillospiraceae bacterium]
MDHVNSGAKTDMFRMRINPEIRKKVEAVYEKNGLTLTDAVNVFFQQSLNAGGFPFPVTEENAELVKAKALSRLVRELKAGDACTQSVSEEEAMRLLGVEP